MEYHFIGMYYENIFICQCFVKMFAIAFLSLYERLQFTNRQQLKTFITVAFYLDWILWHQQLIIIIIKILFKYANKKILSDGRFLFYSNVKLAIGSEVYVYSIIENYENVNKLLRIIFTYPLFKQLSCFSPKTIFAACYHLNII